jgi:uncharacterized protein
MKTMAHAMPLLSDVRSDRDEVCPCKTTFANGKMKIWIDLDNTPHVPFFKPIIRELEQAGFEVALTARDAFQVCDLAEAMGLKPRKVGRHYGKNRFMKVAGLAWRSLQLLPFCLKERPVLGLSHGSRAQILLCNLLRIPTVMIMDYEHAQTPLLLRPKWEIVPKVLLSEELQCKNRDRIRAYEGIKEDVYAPEFVPDAKLVEELGIGGNNIIITVRPPANEAHYHNPESEVLFEYFMEKVCRTADVKAVLLPRNKAQEAQIRAKWPAWFAASKVIVPKGAVDGLNLLWHSDLVVSGGGTMNREAAALGVPVYSIFRGKIGAVDHHLQKQGRLTLIKGVDAIDKEIVLKPRKKELLRSSSKNGALADIVGHVSRILTAENHVTNN